MAEVRPFRGLRYVDAAGDLQSLLAPPTETLFPAEREGYALRSPRNAVAVAQPEGHGDDRSKFVRFARSAARLAEWRRENFLAPEAVPAFYRLEQPIAVPSGSDPVVRTALLAVAALEPNVGIAETPDPKAVEVRLRLLEATRTEFEPTVALYDDPSGAIRAAIKAASPTTSVVASGTTLDPIVDPEAVDAIETAFRGASLFIADGGAGFIAAQRFRKELGSNEATVPEDRFFAALLPLDDPSLVRIPVWRVVRRLPGGMKLPGLLERLSGNFRLEEHMNRNLPRLLESAPAGAVAMATEGGRGYLLTPLDGQNVEGIVRLQGLIEGTLAASGELVEYVTDPTIAVRAVDEGAAAAFLTDSPDFRTLRRAAETGMPLPNRSGAFAPAIPTGFVFRSLGDDTP